MEGRHFVAGPWFAVLEAGGGWTELDRIWISDGNQSSMARVEIRVDWEEVSDEV